MIFAIPIELKIREFTSKIFLSHKILQKTNFDVLIGKKNLIYTKPLIISVTINSTIVKGINKNVKKTNKIIHKFYENL